MKSHVIRVQNDGENHSLGLQIVVALLVHIFRSSLRRVFPSSRLSFLVDRTPYGLPAPVNPHQTLDLGAKSLVIVGDVHGCYDELQELLDTCPQRYHTHLQSSTREFAHTRFHDFRVIIFFIFFFFFFFFKPAISLPVYTSSSADFFTEGLQFRRRCARTSSDRLFLAASHYGRSWSSFMVVTEQRHLLLTQH